MYERRYAPDAPVVSISAGSRATIKDQFCYFQMPDFVCLA
jgi:hypothetical protein